MREDDLPVTKMDSTNHAVLVGETSEEWIRTDYLVTPQR